MDKSGFEDQFLNSLERDFKENFKVAYSITKIDNIGDESNLIKSIIDGTILLKNEIDKQDNGYYIFLTSKALFFHDNPSEELRGFSVYSQFTGIISSHKIKNESTLLGLNYEFQFFKVVKHEFLHLLGLDHCSVDKRCMMITGFPPSNFHNSFDRICSFCFEKIDSTVVKANLNLGKTSLLKRN